MLVAQLLLIPLFQGPNAIIAKWRKLVPSVCDSYRPELHYMRGPGPKWFAKNGTYQSGGPGMSALAPLLGVRRISPPLSMDEYTP